MPLSEITQIFDFSEQIAISRVESYWKTALLSVVLSQSVTAFVQILKRWSPFNSSILMNKFCVVGGSKVLCNTIS